MPSEEELKRNIRSIFYENGKPPSHKNYLAILVVVLIIGIGAYFILSEAGVVPSLWETGPDISSSADVNRAISDMGNILSNASETLDDISREI